MNIFFLTKLQVEEGLFVWRKQGAQGEYTTPPCRPPPLPHQHGLKYTKFL